MPNCDPDCEERTNCDTVGVPGHYQCGRCDECGTPIHHGCWCKVDFTSDHLM